MTKGARVGTAGGNKAVTDIYVGTAGGVKRVVEGWIGTAGGNKQFWPAIPPLIISAATPLSWGGTVGSFSAVVSVDVISGDGPFTYSWTGAGDGAFDDDSAGSTTIRALTNEERNLTVTVTDAHGQSTFQGVQVEP